MLGDFNRVVSDDLESNTHNFDQGAARSFPITQGLEIEAIVAFMNMMNNWFRKFLGATPSARQQ